MTEPSRLRKRPLEADAATIARAADEIDIAGCATIAYSSEDPAHPVEDLFDGRSGPGATRWMSARPNTLERAIPKSPVDCAVPKFLLTFSQRAVSSCISL
jgi:hypothetical protein